MTLALVYSNEPKQQHQPRSPVHVGACEIYVTSREPVQLDGKYWTARFTAGDMFFKLLDRRTDYPNFEAAETASMASDIAFP
jgi:hypothetical protein